MKKAWIVLVVLMGCMGQGPVSEFKEITLSPGSGETFEFYQEGVFLGTSSYTVEKKDTYQGVEAYYISGMVDLSAEGYSLHFTTSYVVNMMGKALYYEFTADLNGEIHTMSAEFGETHVHEVAQRPDEDYDKEIRIGEHTFTLDNNMIGQWDIFFRALQLVEGDTLEANAFAAQPMTTFTVKGSVLEKLYITVKGQEYQCYKLDLSTPPYYMYVTPEGELLKMETKDGTLIIVRAR
jgi:hypothetical protein